MAPKKRPKPKSVTATNAVTKPLMILTEETLADLRYIEPKRSADRVIACLNELYLLVFELRQQHQAPDH